MKTLEHGNFTLDIYYVIDTFPGDNRKLQFTLPNNFKMILRNTNKGRRAGAIKDVLNEIKNPDYVALFDVSIDLLGHRPAKDYIIKCVVPLSKIIQLLVLSRSFDDKKSVNTINPGDIF